jgi:hypothetical protein
MSLYSLTEAYSEIYDHRKVEDLFDNLRFVDYMQDGDIEQVVEELVWEFRDYGNTLDESFEMLSFASTDEVICESYDELIEDILTEATVTKGSQRSQYAGSAQDRVTSGRGDIMAQQSAAKKLARKSGKAVAAGLDAESKQRMSARAARVGNAISKVKSKLSGPISSVKQSISGSAGGLGRATKAMGGKVVEKGKAMLKSILRRGGKAIYGAGKAIEGSGRAASAAPATTRTAKVGRTTVTTTTEPGGSKRQAVGRAVRKVGVALQRKAGKKDEPKMSRADYESRKSERTTSAKKEVGDAFAKPKPMLALPAKTSGQPAVQRTVSARKQEAAKKIAKAAEGSTARGTRFSGPGARLSSQRTKTGYKERLAKFASQLSEQDYNTLVDYILEDMISEGYASDVLEALDLFESLTEDSVIDIALDYFND